VCALGALIPVSGVGCLRSNAAECFSSKAQQVCHSGSLVCADVVTRRSSCDSSMPNLLFALRGAYTTEGMGATTGSDSSMSLKMRISSGLHGRVRNGRGMLSLLNLSGAASKVGVCALLGRAFVGDSFFLHTGHHTSLHSLSVHL
jgi:hypothetical protein